jgi:hypothetical protein
LRKSSGRQLVILRNAQDGALDLGVVDFHAVFLGELKQRALGHHPLEHLLVENILRRRLHVLLLELLHDDALGVVEIVLGDRLVIDHGDDPIDGDDPILRRWTRLRENAGGRHANPAMDRCSKCHRV